MIPYLQMIHLCKLFQDDQEELEDLKEYQQEVSEKIGLDNSQRKILNEYDMISKQVEEMEDQMAKREQQAFLISESNSAIFVPISLIETVLRENRSSTFLKSNYISFLN